MKTIIYTALLGILSLGCDRATNVDVTSDNTLPPITQSGANTFGCKLNGVVFVPNKAIGSTVVEKPIIFYGYYIDIPNQSSRMSVMRQTNLKNLLTVEIYMYRFSAVGVGDYIFDNAYYFNDNNQPFNSYLRCIAKSPATAEWKTYGSYNNSGKLTISRFDINGCSGTFYGKLKEQNGNEEIEITDGRFDFNYKTL
ncbi:hypothetical protein QGN23_10190 [Chryseobacterium gotjawalense]|uniref:Lipoprotein n=1 Tax=Chryseobacterium gotjawalense TaxID=3042315 RepID=A0ABY8RA13_9FLAO|nr:hypothetical protein [Chryseobacterium sp. wdc7]WHF50800.1 hypothetical protein QGN23_10190 [Chryseobacterium sp. wdc7]